MFVEMKGANIPVGRRPSGTGPPGVKEVAFDNRTSVVSDISQDDYDPEEWKKTREILCCLDTINGNNGDDQQHPQQQQQQQQQQYKNKEPRGVGNAADTTKPKHQQPLATTTHPADTQQPTPETSLERLKQLALLRGGYLNHDLRQQVWPVVIGIDPSAIGDETSLPPDVSNYKLSPEQITVIEQDVGRAVFDVPTEIKHLSGVIDEGDEYAELFGGDEEDGASLVPSLPPMTSPPPQSITLGRSFPVTSPLTSPLENMASTAIRTVLPPPPLLENPPSASFRSGSGGSIVKAPTDDSDENSRDESEDVLYKTITTTLRLSRGKLNYYQGFHDLVALSLINLRGDTHLASHFLRTLALTHLYDQTRPHFGSLNAAMQCVIFPVLEEVDEEVHDFLIESCGLDTPVFALSWVLSWFCHDVRDVGVASRIMDFIIVSDPLAPLYMTVAMLVFKPNRMKIMTADCDFAAVHQVLLGLPKEMLLIHRAEKGLGRKGDIFEEVIQVTIHIMRKIPPSEIVEIAKYYRGGQLQTFLDTPSSLSRLTQPPPTPAVVVKQLSSSSLSQIFTNLTQNKQDRKKRRRRILLSMMVLISTVMIYRKRQFTPSSDHTLDNDQIIPPILPSATIERTGIMSLDMDADHLHQTVSTIILDLRNDFDNFMDMCALDKYEDEDATGPLDDLETSLIMAAQQMDPTNPTTGVKPPQAEQQQLRNQHPQPHNATQINNNSAVGREKQSDTSVLIQAVMRRVEHINRIVAKVNKVFLRDFCSQYLDREKGPLLGWYSHVPNNQVKRENLRRPKPSKLKKKLVKHVRGAWNNVSRWAHERVPLGIDETTLL